MRLFDCKCRTVRHDQIKMTEIIYSYSIDTIINVCKDDDDRINEIAAPGSSSSNIKRKIKKKKKTHDKLNLRQMNGWITCAVCATAHSIYMKVYETYASHCFFFFVAAKCHTQNLLKSIYNVVRSRSRSHTQRRCKIQNTQIQIIIYFELNVFIATKYQLKTTESMYVVLHAETLKTTTK